MGRVFLCRDTRLEVDVAVKVLPPEVSSDEEALAQIEREARAAAKFRGCAGILSLLGFEQHGDTWFLVMEFAAGGSLYDRLKKEGRLSEEECRRIGAEVAEALDFAHKERVLHRDIKPANILLSSDGRAKVADFGIAKVLSDASSKMSMMTMAGTPIYMPPEVILQQKVDHRGDLYSLGCMLFEMATGQRPFSGSYTEVAMAKTVPGMPLPDAKALRPDLSDGFLAILACLLAADPDARFQDGASAAAALRGKAPPPPLAPTVALRPGGAAASTARWRLPLIVGTCIVLAAGAAAYLGFSAGRGGELRSPAVSGPAPSLEASVTRTAGDPPVDPVRASASAAAPFLDPGEQRSLQDALVRADGAGSDAAARDEALAPAKAVLLLAEARRAAKGMCDQVEAGTKEALARLEALLGGSPGADPKALESVRGAIASAQEAVKAPEPSRRAYDLALKRWKTAAEGLKDILAKEEPAARGEVGTARERADAFRKELRDTPIQFADRAADAGRRSEAAAPVPGDVLRSVEQAELRGAARAERDLWNSLQSAWEEPPAGAATAGEAVASAGRADGMASEGRLLPAAAEYRKAALQFGRDVCRRRARVAEEVARRGFPVPEEARRPAEAAARAPATQEAGPSESDLAGLADTASVLKDAVGRVLAGAAVSLLEKERAKRCTSCSTTGRCAACKGTGKTSTPCTACVGKGTILQGCPTCAGAGKQACPRCLGSGIAQSPCAACGARGIAKCDKCGGKGRVDCAACGKTGYARGAPGVLCTVCNGAGKVKCADCTGTGTKQCAACGGKGQSSGPCAACQGKGSVSCVACEGRGKATVPCQRCEAGVVVGPCIRCSGRGACPDCGGTGRRE
jgi:serine/threonine-protein kinase